MDYFRGRADTLIDSLIAENTAKHVPGMEQMDWDAQARTLRRERAAALARRRHHWTARLWTRETPRRTA